MSNMVLWGANELPWPIGFQIGVTICVFPKCLKSGAFRGTLRRFKDAQEATRCRIWSYGAAMNSPGPEVFKLVSHFMPF